MAITDVGINKNPEQEENVRYGQEINSKIRGDKKSIKLDSVQKLFYFVTVPLIVMSVVYIIHNVFRILATH